jgi:hypothetical protein
MINAIQAAEVLQTGVVAIIAATVVFKIVPMFRLDCYRQKMFAVRDELFDYAADGNISFADPAYVLLRNQMNGMIRYGHQLTLFRMSVTWLMRMCLSEKPQPQWHESWEKALDNVKRDDVRQRLEAFHDKSGEIAGKHVLFGSLVLWIAVLIVAFALLARGAAVGVGQLFSSAARKIQSGPINQQFIEEEAVGAQA